MLRAALIVAMYPPLLTAAAQDVRHHVAARDVVLRLERAPKADQPLDAWARRAGESAWQPLDCAAAGDTVRVRLPDDGEFELCLTPRASPCAPPEPAPADVVRIVVDTAPPLLLVRAARLSPDGAVLWGRALYIDEHPAEQPLRLFFQTKRAAIWQDGGVPRWSGAEFSWERPASATAIRVVAVDRAGNQSHYDLPQPLPAPPRPDEPAERPILVADEQPAASPSPPAGSSEALPATAQAVNCDPILARVLRQRAAQHLAAGEWPLAAARYEDALRICPADPELLTDSGRALLRVNQWEAAEARFRAALARRPADFAARDGLAATLAGAGRFRAAREELLELTRQAPASAAHWLRLGDVEHRLGLRAAAAVAWRTAATQAVDEAQRTAAQRRLRLLGN